MIRYAFVFCITTSMLVLVDQTLNENNLFLFTDNLTSLIQAATDSGIEFVYALSPGLDISFSSQKDVQCLKRKLEQVFCLFLKFLYEHRWIEGPLIELQGIDNF